MPIITLSKASDEVAAEVLLKKFFERIQIDSDGDAICVLEFIVHVTDSSSESLSKLDILVPHFVTEVKDLTKTFENLNLLDNQVYTNGFKLLDANNKKYEIDGIEANLANLTGTPERDRNDYTKIRIKFNKIISGNSAAFRLKIDISRFAKIYKSIGVFEISLYYTWALSNHIETMQEFEVNGISIDRKNCEVWVTLPRDTLYGMATPLPQQIKVNQKNQILSNDLYDSQRSAVYWDLEDSVFDLPGRSLGDIIKPGGGVRIYCEMKRPHVTAETFEEKMSATLSIIDKLKESAYEAEKSLFFIERYGKMSFIITLIISIIAIIISVLD